MPDAGPRIEITNWATFQHYKERSPPWIKLHKKLLDNRGWHALSGDASKLLAECWLLASDHGEGWIELDTADLAWRLRRNDVTKLARCLIELQENDFLRLVDHDASALLAPASSPLAECLPETERETEGERETENRAVSIETEAAAPSFPQSDEPDEPSAEQPTEPDAELRAAIAPAVRLHLWQDDRLPKHLVRQQWSMGREIDIARQIVQDKRATLEELVGAIGLARSMLQLGDGPLTLRVFNVRDKHDRLAVCVAAWRKRQLRQAIENGDSAIAKAVRGES